MNEKLISKLNYERGIISLTMPANNHYQLWNKMVGMTHISFGNEKEVVNKTLKYLEEVSKIKFLDLELNAKYLEPELKMSDKFRELFQEHSPEEYAVLKYLADLHKQNQSLGQKISKLQEILKE